VKESSPKKNVPNCRPMPLCSNSMCLVEDLQVLTEAPIQDRGLRTGELQDHIVDPTGDQRCHDVFHRHDFGFAFAKTRAQLGPTDVLQVHRDLRVPVQVGPPKQNARVGFTGKERESGRCSGVDAYALNRH
jgi:hypothetical protein